MAEITGVLLNVYNDKVEKITLDGSLEGFYQAIDCRCIDIVSRIIGGKRFDIICDDEGLFRDKPKISAINNLGEPMLVGNLFIVKQKDDDIESLTEEEAQHVIDHIQTMYTKMHPEGYRMLTQVEY